MHFTTAISLSALAGCGLAAPFSPFPLSDGFPNPSPEQLAMIETTAGGTLPNGPLPTTLQPEGATALKLIALNELFEVVFFTELLENITTNVPGYELSGYDANYVIAAITAVQAQEQLHAIGANGILMSAGIQPIQPCTYTFPVTTFESAIALAATFTDVVLGVLPQAQTVFANDAGDETALIALLGSIIAQEGEQDGWYRSVQKKTPSAAPFLTGEAPQFAYTALLNFIVPGSCPSTDQIDIPTFGPLTVVTTPTAADSTLTYSVPGTVSPEANSLVYLSGQNLPVTVPISNVYSQGGLSYFCAEFPFAAGFARGLTIAALVTGSGVSFDTAAEVAAVTLYGPGLIEVD